MMHVFLTLLDFNLFTTNRGYLVENKKTFSIHEHLRFVVVASKCAPS